MSLLTDITEHADLAPAQLMSYINEYEAMQPYDCMIDTARAVVYFFAENYKESEKWILSALKKNPANYMNHFYYALISKALGQYMVSAVECLVSVNFVTQFTPLPEFEALLRQINDVLAEIGPKLSELELKEFQKQKNILQVRGDFFPMYLCDQQKWSVYHGDFLYFDKRNQYNDYICIGAQSYIDGINHAFQQGFAQPNSGYALTPIESWKAAKTNRLSVEHKNHILALAATIPGQKFTITPSVGEAVNFYFDAPNIYHYVNMDETGVLSADQDFIVSKLVPATGKTGKKKLIITINVNSISQWYLSQTNYEAMPHTKKFFAQGTIFKNCYSTAEGTFPSEIALHTGLCTTHHHIIYRSPACQFPSDSETAAEIFNHNGYFTASVSGSIGTSPYLGGLRGFDCAKRKFCLGFPDHVLIQDAISFMEAFPDTNQYLSVCLFTPHTSVEAMFCGVFNHSMPQQVSLSFRSVYGPQTQGSAATVQKYQAALKETDQQLKRIYDYVLSHYTEDEYIFCLCSDHGTAVIGQEERLLKAERTNTVLMFRGAGVPVGISEEYINHIDYLPILTKLAGVSYDFSKHDCVLPRTFGGPGRDYVYSESICPKQTYKAAIRTDEFEYYFETNANTDIDGLIDLSQGYTQKTFSIKTGKIMDNSPVKADFEAVVFDHIKESIRY